MSGRNMYASMSRGSQPVFNKLNSDGMMLHSGPEPALYRYPLVSYPQLQPAFPGGANLRPSYRSFTSGRPVVDATPSTVAQPVPILTVPVSDATEPKQEELLAAVAEATASETSAATANSPQQRNQLANTKEKTPMCLVNELARFNKVQHQYCLTDEQGPAHKKTFYVKLKLGDEEFTASGPSIKKAQHAAAAVALAQTKYQHPPPKRQTTNAAANLKNGTNTSITPTVELNALAMKRGELAVYRPFERKVAAPPNPILMSAYDYCGGFYNHRYRYPRPPHRFNVMLKVGQQEFVGEGETLQAARHNAASMALKVLRSLPMPEHETSNTTEAGDGTAADSTSAAVTDNELLKSEISLVHEIALKRNFTVEFEAVKEWGQPHMRTFMTRCKCGDLETEGEGNSKKLSKKRAAEKMLVELKKLPPLPPSLASEKPKRNFVKPKQSKNLIKSVLNNCTAGVNPISRLIQIQQAKKEKEPVFSQISESGQARSREFVVQVTVGENVCTGTGSNKRLAKRHAAEQMLQLLGYSQLPAPPIKPAIKTAADGSQAPTTSAATASSPVADKKVTFVDSDVGHGEAPLPLSPGMIRVPAASRGNIRSPAAHHQHATTVKNEPGLVETDGDSVLGNKIPGVKVTKNIIAAGTRPVAGSSLGPPCSVRPMDQLNYLSRLMGFEILVTNIPKDNTKSEYLTVVTLCTIPPQFYHGSGATVEASNDSAALGALCKLSEVGLDSASNALGNTGAGDGQPGHSGRLKSERTAVVTSTAAKLEAK